jgi:hypothetical protein
MCHRIEGHLDGQNVMVPSVRVLCPDGVVPSQQDHSSIHYSRVVQEWLPQQAGIELSDWPPRAPDMNPTENTWSEVNSTLQETWPVLPPRNTDAFWTPVSDAWDEAAPCQRYVLSLTDSMPRRMHSAVEAQSFWTSY